MGAANESNRMFKKLAAVLLAGCSKVVDLLSELFESRAKALALLSAFLLGVVLCSVLGSNDPYGTCQVSPRWLLVNVRSTLMVSNPENDGFLESILDDIRGILNIRGAGEVELGLQMLNTCYIGQLRSSLCDSQYCTVIEMLPGPNVESHEITVSETISEICAVLDCADATARPLTQVADPDEQRIQTDVEGEKVPRRDRGVLVALYEATSGANWTNNDKWMTTDPISEWHGVSSFPATPGSLTNLSALMLRGNELTGSIPAELGKLTNLRGLDLGGNELTGPIPAELGSLTNLTALVLYGNKLAGSIPVELGNLANLTELGIDTNTGLCLAEGFPLTSQFATLAQRRGLLVCSDDAGAGPRRSEASASVVGGGELRPVFRSRLWRRLDPVS